MCGRIVWSFMASTSLFLLIQTNGAIVVGFQPAFIRCFVQKGTRFQQKLPSSFNPWMTCFNSRHHYKNFRSQGKEKKDVILLATKQEYVGVEGGDDSFIDFDSVNEMDILLFKRCREDDNDVVVELGAMQEDGTVAPLSAWSLEPTGTDDAIEFLVDEEDRFPGLVAEDIQIISIIDDTFVYYGSRQVGGGKGPGNPHGEESELLYYIERNILDQSNVKISLNPELEILW